LLAFLVPLDAADPAAVYQRLRREVELYSQALAHRPHLLVFTKRDLLPPEAELFPVAAPEAQAVQVISSASGQGLEDLKESLWRRVLQLRLDEADRGHEVLNELE
jgi:GTP-binding protein